MRPVLLGLGTALMLATCAGAASTALATKKTHRHHISGVFAPLSDGAAAAHVIRTGENRPSNFGPNHTVPTAAQLRAFRSARYASGMTTVQWNPYYRYVTGRYAGTTDQIIQWASWKWGIPTDLLRAMYMQESRESQFQLGDPEPVSASWYAAYPLRARLPGVSVYQTMGISQIKWRPDGSVGAGTEPLRWMSTAFAADYNAATLRFYYDDPQGKRKAWGDPSYRPHQGWYSIAAWYDPYPWGNRWMNWYIGFIKHQLNTRSWYTAKIRPWPSHIRVPEARIVHRWRPG